MTHQAARPVTATELESGGLYLSVSYLDGDLLIPIVETFIFLGKDIFSEGAEGLYFQNAESYFTNGAYRVDEDRVEEQDRLLVATPDNLSNMFDIANASDAMAHCAERWRSQKK
jgi:hypothetical protein